MTQMMPHFELLVTYFSVRKHHLEQIQNDLYKLQRTVETFLVGEFSRKNNFISHVNTKKFFFFVISCTSFKVVEKVFFDNFQIL